MTIPLLFPMFGSEYLADPLVSSLGGERGHIEVRRFPDGESYLRYRSPLKDRSVILLAQLDHPDAKIVQLVFAVEAARELGAVSVGLVAPYLPYMRQDRRFHSGEAITSHSFASLLAMDFDWLVTIDPHIHRIQSLSEIYTIPTTVLHSARLIAQWINQSVENAVLIGPDEESRQWVSAVAKMANVDFFVLTKKRLGDHEVEISIPDIKRWSSHTPVIVDDIISTGQTMIETVHHLVSAGLCAPICIGIHGIFVDEAYHDLINAGTGRVVTCNTIRHETNVIDVSDLLAEGIRTHLSED